MKSDVKAVRVTGTGSVFAGRTRLRGIILNIRYQYTIMATITDSPSNNNTTVEYKDIKPLGNECVGSFSWPSEVFFFFIPSGKECEP